MPDTRGRQHCNSFLPTNDSDRVGVALTHGAPRTGDRRRERDPDGNKTRAELMASATGCYPCKLCANPDKP